MKVLVVGSGGREHAITRALAASDMVEEIHAGVSNRNPGIVELADSVRELDTNSPEEVVGYAEEAGVGYAVVGPEAPLAEGVVDALEEADVYGFGPRADEARIETDKAWARRFMDENGIDGTPEFAVFENAEETAEYIVEYDGDVAVKPHGLTGGKGVRVTGDQLTKEEAQEYVLESEWDDWVVEERLVGEEFTLQAFVADGELRPSPAVQDHKRAYDGDEGPNTGGMGSYTDAGRILPFMNEDDYKDALDIMRQTVDALPEYRGVLYGQFMLTAEGPKVVEFNARFGDPEAMNVLPLLETDFGEIVRGASEGNMPDVSFAERATVCKYAVPDGYPTNPESGAEITLDIDDEDEDTLVFYASVDARDGKLYTTTSRSVAVVGLGDDITTAEERAENALAGLGDGLRVRHDIGKPDLVQKRIDHMVEIR
ncbi:MAG: phosphoribosylamine--glycine ligase [Halobacteriales archaeon]|nr:phosphoribosylamine--glycine ligase [Halobacteriales archaeon]